MKMGEGTGICVVGNPGIKCETDFIEMTIVATLNVAPTTW